MPKILFANARSAVNKLESISVTIQQQNIKCLALAETWFNNNHSVEMTQIPEYQCFRDDRCNKVGGGVAIWAHFSLQPSCFILEGKPSYVEAVAVRVMSWLFIICIYIPPIVSTRCVYKDEILRFLTDTFDNIACVCPSSETVICGDFNRFAVTDVCNTCNMLNMFSGITYNTSQLDYFLMTELLSNQYRVTAEAPIDNSKIAHVSLMATPQFDENVNLSSTQKTKVSIKTVYDMRQSYVNDFVDLLCQTDWSSLHDGDLDLDTKTAFFHHALKEAFVAAIPSSEVVLTGNEKPWITPLLKLLINQRWEAYRSRNFPRYHQLKKKIKSELSKAKASWIGKNQRKDIWKTVRTLSGKAVTDPLASLCSQFSSKRAAADRINEKFAAHFQSSGEFSHYVSHTLPQKDILYVPPQFVCNELCNLNTRKSSPDLPLKLYKAAAYVLAEPLATLYNQSLAAGTVPLIWKCATVSAVPKCSAPSIEDLRPISLLPAPMKILERFVLRVMMLTIFEHYGKNQFGFRPRSSTTCALIAIDDFITTALDRADVEGVQVVAYDLSKAFDKLKYDVILSRLRECELSPAIVSWFVSYFTSRKQFVKVGTECSRVIHVTSGVPQGSVVGPFIFSLVAGSFDFESKDCKVIKYADDFTMCATLKRNSPNSHISDFHNSFLNWTYEHGLVVNLTKCKSLCVSFCRNCSPVILSNVSIVRELKILGVTFDEGLNWNVHVDNIVKCASRRLYLLRLLRNVAPRKVLISVYNAIVRSYLEYASPLLVGLSSTNAGKIRRIQRRFHRLLCGSECRNGCLESLDDRRRIAAVKLFLQSRNTAHVLHRLTPKCSRSGRYILMATARTRRLNSFFPFMSMFLNARHSR